jgi:hypothetical protein
MAIAYDTVTHSGFSSASSFSFSHTTSGSDRLLIVHVYDGNDRVTNVTYNGVGLTLVEDLLMTGAAAGQYIQLWYLLNPASGTNNVTITGSASMSLYASAVSYTGVEQTGQPDASTKQAASPNTSLTTTVTTTDDNCWLMGYAYRGTTISAGAGTTLRGGSVAGILEVIDSNGAKTPAGSHSLITTSSSTFAGHVMASFSPATGGPTPSRGGILLAW